MKKIVFLSLALLVCTLCSAKKSVKKQAQEKTQQEFEMPCMSESNDTPEYYCGFGVGQGRTFNDAIMQAHMSANEDLHRKSGKEYIKEVEIVCQKFGTDKSGRCTCYMAVRMPKNDTVEQK
ncbi:MAG: hypothetical protein MJ009_03965 [Paludibacteraceae bacterium]|nr:hypothetical protein [Paludibacteraceae bacterium]